MDFDDNCAIEATIVTDPMYAGFRALPICSDLDDQECMLLFSCFDLIHVAAGEILYEKNSESDHSIRLILKGRVSVSAGSTETSRLLQQGDVFGLFSFLDEQRNHAARVKAVTDVVALAINREYFNVIVTEEPALGRLLHHFMFRLLAPCALKHENEYLAGPADRGQEHSDA
ncbi:MAG: Crp/Fnr family transcriptional regulator [Mariprofundus sp.]